MKALVVLLGLISCAAHAEIIIDADLKLTDVQKAYAQAGLKDLTPETTRQRFATVFVNADKELPRKCDFKTTVTRFQEMPLAHQGRMLALLWKTEPLCKTYGTVQSTRVVWLLPDGRVETIAEREGFDPECGTSSYSYLPVGLRTFFGDEWIYFEETSQKHGCVSEMEVKTTVGHWFHPKKIKLASLFLKQDSQIDDDNRRLIRTYTVLEKKCAKLSCPTEKRVELVQPGKKTMVLEKSRTSISYMPEYTSLSHQ
jgi:hypothetical protein